MKIDVTVKEIWSYFGLNAENHSPAEKWENKWNVLIPSPEKIQIAPTLLYFINRFAAWFKNYCSLKRALMYANIVERNLKHYSRVPFFIVIIIHIYIYTHTLATQTEC